MHRSAVGEASAFVVGGRRKRTDSPCAAADAPRDYEVSFAAHHCLDPGPRAAARLVGRIRAFTTTPFNARSRVTTSKTCPSRLSTLVCTVGQYRGLR